MNGSLSFRWVNSIPVFSISFSPAVTQTRQVTVARFFLCESSGAKLGNRLVSNRDYRFLEQQRRVPGGSPAQDNQRQSLRPVTTACFSTRFLASKLGNRLVSNRDYRFLEQQRRVVATSFVPKRWAPNWSCPARRTAETMVKRKKIESPPAELQAFLEEVGLALREQLNRMHESEGKIDPQTQEDGAEHESGGIFPSE